MPADVIFGFYGIGTPRREIAPNGSPYWISHCQFEEIINEIVVEQPDRIKITFDDGNASDIEICAPFLASKGISACFFVLASRIGTAGSLSESDLGELQRMGFEIGTHGFAHVDWRTLDPESEITEFVTAREIISAACGRTIGKVAIPFGLYNRSVVSSLRRHRYEAIYTCDGVPARRGALIRPRTDVRSDMTLDYLRDVVRGVESPRRRFRRRVSMLTKRLI